MRDSDKYDRSNIARILLFVSGLIFVLSALVYNEFLLTFLDSNPPLLQTTVAKIRLVQMSFLLSGAVLLTLSECVRRVSWLVSFMNQSLVTNILLAILVIFLPLSILEFSLKPFLLKTTIFVRDSELGWKLRPNTEDAWFGVIVRINGKGLRGPELDYTKPSAVTRILYLGDSVSFGDKLKSHDQTFPYRTEAVLEDGLGREIETINAGVGGYSPWQEYIYLVKEGIKYDPDLVIISFVLNDVTDKFKLKQFGGLHEGKQLSRTVSSTYDWFVRTSSIAYYARAIGARIRFGDDVQRGAQRQEIIDIQSLVAHPDRPDVQRAWKITLENLGKIFAFCKEHDLPVVLVVFPYALQFEDMQASAAPQKIVSRYAFDNQVPVIDLLPLFDEKAKEHGMNPKEYFLDRNHLSPLGSTVTATILANVIQQAGLIAEVQGK